MSNGNILFTTKPHLKVTSSKYNFDDNNEISNININNSIHLMGSKNLKSSQENLLNSNQNIFKEKTGKLKWKEVLRINIENIINNYDLASLDAQMENLVFSHIDENDLEIVPESSIVKLIKLLQIIIEYMLFTQHRLDTENRNYQNTYNILIKDLQFKDNEINELKNRLQNFKKEVQIKQGLINKLGRGNSVSGFKNEYYFECHICEKKRFISEALLQSHYQRRHNKLKFEQVRNIYSNQPTQIHERNTEINQTQERDELQKSQNFENSRMEIQKTFENSKLKELEVSMEKMLKKINKIDNNFTNTRNKSHLSSQATDFNKTKDDSIALITDQLNKKLNEIENKSFTRIDSISNNIDEFKRSVLNQINEISKIKIVHQEPPPIIEKKIEKKLYLYPENVLRMSLESDEKRKVFENELTNKISKKIPIDTNQTKVKQNTFVKKEVKIIENEENIIEIENTKKIVEQEIPKVEIPKVIEKEIEKEIKIPVVIEDKINEKSEIDNKTEILTEKKVDIHEMYESFKKRDLKFYDENNREKLKFDKYYQINQINEYNGVHEELINSSIVESFDRLNKNIKFNLGNLNKIQLEEIITFIKDIQTETISKSSSNPYYMIYYNKLINHLKLKDYVITEEKKNQNQIPKKVEEIQKKNEMRTSKERTIPKFQRVVNDEFSDNLKQSKGSKKFNFDDEFTH